jgi:hypothetical protein
MIEGFVDDEISIVMLSGFIFSASWGITSGVLKAIKHVSFLTSKDLKKE